MSISTITFNATMLAAYGYHAYSQYPDTEGESRTEIQKTFNSAEYYYLEKIKKTMNRVISHNYEIFLVCNEFVKDSVSIPTVKLIAPKKIGINYRFYLKDQQACEFLVRSAITYYESTQSHPLKSLLTLSTSQMTIGCLAYYKSLSLQKTITLTSLINIPLFLLFAHSQPKRWDRKILEHSTDQELLGGRRFFHVLLHNGKYCWKGINPTLKVVVREVNQLIKDRKVYFNAREERRRENLLNQYLKPFCEQIVQNLFIQSRESTR